MSGHWADFMEEETLSVPVTLYKRLWPLLVYASQCCVLCYTFKNKKEPNASLEFGGRGVRVSILCFETGFLWIEVVCFQFKREKKTM